MSVVGQEETSQAVFVGKFPRSLDPKKRLTIPSEWREQVGEQGKLYVMPDVHDQCLFVFPASEMMHRIQSMRQHGVGDKKARSFARVLASQSDLVTWDSQGRIRIKDELLASANLTDQVELVGALDRFELWNPDTLRKTGALDRDSLLDAAQYVGF